MQIVNEPKEIIIILKVMGVENIFIVQYFMLRSLAYVLHKNKNCCHTRTEFDRY